MNLKGVTLVLGSKKASLCEILWKMTLCNINMTEPIDVNSVMAEELKTICGVSEVIVQEIIKKREEPEVAWHPVILNPPPRSLPQLDNHGSMMTR